MPWTDVPSKADEYFHTRTDDPYWNESSFVSFRIPERELMGVVWYYFRPNQATAVGGPVLWDGSGSSLADCLHFAYDYHMPIPEGAEMCDFSFVNGFSAQTLEVQKSHRFTYEGPECQFDLTFTASHDPCYVSLESNKDNPGVADWVVKVEDEGVTTGHYDHFGRMNGTITVLGEAIPVVDSAALRDRSWGPRKVISTQTRLRGSYGFAMHSDTSGFVYFANAELPLDSDPVAGTTERITAGYYMKDGVIGRLVRGERRCIRAEDGRPISETVEARDDLGRVLKAAAETSSTLVWPGYFGNTLMYWGLESWSFDGYANVPGEVQDHMMSRHYRRFRQGSTVSAVGAGKRDA